MPATVRALAVDFEDEAMTERENLPRWEVLYLRNGGRLAGTAGSEHGGGEIWEVQVGLKANRIK